MSDFDGYDNWKLRTPPEYDGFEPEPEDDGKDALIAAWRDKVTTWRDYDAERYADTAWCACVGEYDLDAKVGQGATEGEAISDLLWQMGIEGD